MFKTMAPADPGFNDAGSDKTALALRHLFGDGVPRQCGGISLFDGSFQGNRLKSDSESGAIDQFPK